jgi:hypothetical protein
VNCYPIDTGNPVSEQADEFRTVGREELVGNFRSVRWRSIAWSTESQLSGFFFEAGRLMRGRGDLGEASSAEPADFGGLLFDLA